MAENTRKEEARAAKNAQLRKEAAEAKAKAERAQLSKEAEEAGRFAALPWFFGGSARPASPPMTLCHLCCVCAGLSFEDYERQRAMEALGVIAACTVVVCTCSWVASRGM